MLQTLYLGCVKSLRKQHDFTNLLQVGHHHSDRPEEGLQVVRQLCAPSVARVHCDEDTTALVQSNLLA